MAEKALMLKPIQKKRVSLKIVGETPLVMHAWNGKALEMMRLKHAGKKTKERSIRNPEEEGENAKYKTEDGKDGVKAIAIKASILNAAHKDLGIEKTLVRKALHLGSSDPNCILPIEFESMEIREDIVRVGMGSTDLRYRPYYYGWSMDIEFVLDTELLQTQDLITLLNRAGFGCGIGEMRPERDGEFGRFRVDTSHPVTEEVIE